MSYNGYAKSLADNGLSVSQLEQLAEDLKRRPAVPLIAVDPFEFGAMKLQQMREDRMRAYMCFHSGDQRDGAMLAFAESARQARAMSYGFGWGEPERWIEWRAIWQRNLAWQLAALYEGRAAVIDSPPTCTICYLWGGAWVRGTTICEDCKEYEEDFCEAVATGAAMFEVQA